jgi:hypothetical protein
MEGARGDVLDCELAARMHHKLDVVPDKRAERALIRDP